MRYEVIIMFGYDNKVSYSKPMTQSLISLMMIPYGQSLTERYQGGDCRGKDETCVVVCIELLQSRSCFDLCMTCSSEVYVTT